MDQRCDVPSPNQNFIFFGSHERVGAKQNATSKRDQCFQSMLILFSFSIRRCFKFTSPWGPLVCLIMCQSKSHPAHGKLVEIKEDTSILCFILSFFFKWNRLKSVKREMLGLFARAIVWCRFGARRSD